MQTLRGQAWRIIGVSSGASADTRTGTRSAASSKVGTTAGARAEARARSRSGASSSSRRRRSIRRHCNSSARRAAAGSIARTAVRSSCSTHTCAGTRATARCSKAPARGAKAGRCAQRRAAKEARAGSTAGRRHRLLSATATAAAAAASHLATSAHARRSDRDRILPPPVLRLRPNLPDASGEDCPSDGFRGTIRPSVARRTTWPSVAATPGPVCPPCGGAVSSTPSSAASPGQQFAPKHGVRMLRSMLELSMVLPLLSSESVAAIDLEGNLTPTSPECGIDLLQIYLPIADVVLLIHLVSLPKQPVADLLRPWLSSPSHTKVLCDARVDADALHHLYGIRLAGVVDVQLCHAAATGELQKARPFLAYQRHAVIPAALLLPDWPHQAHLHLLLARALRANLTAQGGLRRSFDQGRAPFPRIASNSRGGDDGGGRVAHVPRLRGVMARQTAGAAVQARFRLRDAGG